MTPSDIRLLRVAQTRVSAWLHADATIGTLPDCRETTCLWLTLCGKRSVMSESLQQGSRARVVVLYQTGKVTPPQVIWPALAHLCATTPAETPGVTLILTGNASLSQQRDWTQYLSLSTPGAPPTGRLLLRFALYCLPPAVADRAVNIARRVFRRGSARE
ncbi:hypothetical protein R5P12_003525 [Klebsiella aerogenes]|nr:hypothetical protein [Klebsiella aerogenes]HEO1675216.1 hypothetical protein [Klebsiella aerogenes]